MPEWVTPWIIVAVVLGPLFFVERWMHKHIQGVALLLTNNPQAAVLIYYLLLLPGVALHEGSQWLMAKALRVPVKQFKLWPEKDPATGRIRLGLVEIEKGIDTYRATAVGLIPPTVGVAALAFIGSTFFDLSILSAAFASADLPTMLRGIGQFTATPDFWLWMYFVFAIANAMLPEEHDHINWWILLGGLGAIAAFLLILDLGLLIQAGLEGPFAQMGSWLSLAFGMALGIDLLVMGVITIMEQIFSRLLDRELEYT